MRPPAAFKKDGVNGLRFESTAKEPVLGVKGVLIKAWFVMNAYMFTNETRRRKEKKTFERSGLNIYSLACVDAHI